MSFFVKLGGATGATLVVVVVEAVATSRPTTHSTLPALLFSMDFYATNKKWMDRN